jgi:hypothetical protein
MPTTTPTRPLAALSALLAFVALAAGCGSTKPEHPAHAAARPAPSAAHPASYTGPVTGTRALVAVLSDGRAIRAYACDDGHHAHWFTGHLQDGRATLHARDHHATLTLALSADRATGTLTQDGRAHPFTAARASGRAGLYRAAAHTKADRLVEAAWVLDDQGRTQRGVELGVKQGSIVHFVRAAPPLDPRAATVTLPDAGPVAVTKLESPGFAFPANVG